MRLITFLVLTSTLSVSSLSFGDQVLGLLTPDEGLEEEVLRLCMDRTFNEHDFLQLLDHKEDLEQCLASPRSDRQSRHFEWTTTVFRIIYNIIGRTGHSPKSLQLARQMNVSFKQFKFPIVVSFEPSFITHSNFETFAKAF